MGDTARDLGVINRLVQWANDQPHVRVMLLESSRASEGAPIDLLSDYDVLLVVSDTKPFSQHETWLHDFGKILVLFRGKHQMYGLTGYNRLVLYEDETKIDCIVWPMALLQRVLGEPQLPDLLDHGYQVLVDKDHVAQGLKPPTYTAFIPKRPTEKEYLSLIEEFWWETIYVAKNLWRDELMHVKYNLDFVMKFELLRRLLEWKIEIDHNWSWKPGAIGRGLKKHLDSRTYIEFANTYVGAEIDENWTALFKTTGLFRRVAIEVGDALGYRYPSDLDERVTSYLQSIRSLEHTPTMSVEEYFELEENNPDTRYEYLDGYAYMMAGGTANHATISGNIYALLKSLLHGGPCRAYNSDMKVRVSEKRYFHPDVTISCDARDRGTADFISSPRLVVEVLSPSTEAHDRGRKLQCYLACPTIEEYLLVDSRSMRIEIYRKEQKKWIYDAFEAGDEVDLESLDVHFLVINAYEDVVFEKKGNNKHSGK